MTTSATTTTARRWLLVVLAIAMLGAGCSSSAKTAGPTTTVPGVTTSTGSRSTTTNPGLAGALPEGCDATPVAAAQAPLAFAVGGRVYAVDPSAAASGQPVAPHCLFPTTDPGLFSWGPRGDRVLLRGMEVRPIGDAPNRPKGSVQVSYYSWSRPTGTTVVFINPDQSKLERADMGTSAVRDITPIPGVKYGDLAYHPSGLSIGFVATDPNQNTTIWMATNQGQNAVPLVKAGVDTVNHLVFAHDGVGLLYSRDLDTHHALARYNLTTGQIEPDLWTGAAPIADILETKGLPGAGLTIGADCKAHQAVYTPLDGTSGTPLAPSLNQPTAIVSRVDAGHFVIAAGGCQGPSDLYLAGADGATNPTLLVRSVDAAASRAPEPTPAPPLPPQLPAAGFA